MADPNKVRSATLSLKLKSDTGYESTETCRVSPQQWRQIQAIVNEPDPLEMVPCPAPKCGSPGIGNCGYCGGAEEVTREMADEYHSRPIF